MPPLFESEKVAATAALTVTLTVVVCSSVPARPVTVTT